MNHSLLSTDSVCHEPICKSSVYNFSKHICILPIEELSRQYLEPEADLHDE